AARLLRGTSPPDPRVDQPPKFVFIANLLPAGPPRLTIPPTLRARADEVIELCEGRGRFKNETPPPKFSASGCGRCRAAGHFAPGLGAGLSDAAGAYHRRRCSRRPD